MRANLSIFTGCLILLATTFAAPAQTGDAPARTAGGSPALALVILYDGSGSMADQVPDVRGELTAKYVLANRAVITGKENLA